jgi:hypothetical protein
VENGGGHVRLQGKTDDQSLSNNNRNRVETTSLKLFRLDIFECFEWEEKNRTANKIEKKKKTTEIKRWQFSCL